MAAEVPTSTRPGRPTLLLSVSAGLLAGVLGLAWLQVRDARALGPEVHIDGTPLIVQAPKGWIQHPEDPSSFVLTVREIRRQRELQIVQRRIRFSFERRPSFRSPAHGLSEGALNIEPARVGPFDAVQFSLPVPRAAARRLYFTEKIFRRACTPRGDLITVEYTPLGEISASDREQFDDVCRALRVDDASLSVAAEDALQQAGVKFSTDDAWRIIGPEFPGVPGLYVGGSIDGMPAWSIGVFRTWLSPTRTPKDLLRDAGRNAWGVALDEARIGEQTIRDGITMWTARREDFSSTDDSATAAVRIIVQSRSEAALLFVWAAKPDHAAARAAADQIAGSLEFAPVEPFSSVESAEANGRKLVGELDWPAKMRAIWGRKHEAYFVSKSGQSESVHFEVHTAQDDDANAGFEGANISLYKNGETRTQWTLYADGIGYDYRVASFSGGNRESVALERRSADSDEVEQTSSADPGAETRRVRVGPAYVCPPAEWIVEWLVSKKDTGAYIFEASSHLGRGIHNRLLFPLPPAEDGVHRVLLLEDYQPFGILLGFESLGEWLYQIQPGWRMDKTTREAAERRASVLTGGTRRFPR